MRHFWVPTPQTTPTPVPAASLCDRLGYVPTPDTRCTRDENKSKFKADLDAAIDKVILEHGNIFENGSGGVRVKNFGAFVVNRIGLPTPPPPPIPVPAGCPLPSNREIACGRASASKSSTWAPPGEPQTPIL